MKIHTEPSNLVGRPVESMQIMLRVVAEGNDRLIPVGAPVACRGNAAHFEPIPNPEAG